MSFLARCPHCHRDALAPDDDLGRSVACHGCQADFVLVPELSAPPSPSAWPPAPAAPDEPPERAERFEPSPLAVMDVPAEPEPEPLPAARRRRPVAEDIPGDGIGPALWGLAGGACLCAAAAGVSASVTGLTGLVIPFALAGLLLGGVAVVQFVGRAAEPPELAVPGVPTAGSALVLLLALFAPDYLSPQYEASRTRDAEDPDAITRVLVAGSVETLEELGSVSGGVDATRVALTRRGIQVRVVKAAVGPVELDTAKLSFTKERYLSVTVEILPLVHRDPVSFRPWGGTGVPVAQLSAGGKPLAPANLGGRSAKDVPRAEAPLAPLRPTTVKLLAEAPAAIPEVLLVELPSEAWGQTGPFRFRVPAAMVAVSPVSKVK